MGTPLLISGNEVLASGTAVLNADDNMEIKFEEAVVVLNFSNKIGDEVASYPNINGNVISIFLKGFVNQLGTTLTIAIGRLNGRNVNLRIAVSAIIVAGKVGARMVSYTILYGEVGAI